VRARDGEISASGLYCVVCNLYIGNVVCWLEARQGLVASIELQSSVHWFHEEASSSSFLIIGVVSAGRPENDLEGKTRKKK